ncbi:unnamed protein product, partial [Choristocarpus tenellus]
MSKSQLLPRHHEEFRSKEYWNTFFEQRTEAFEWYGEYSDLRHLMHLTIRPSDRILVIGCGNSNFSAELYDDGYEDVENVDFSQPVVAEMCRLHVRARPRMTWRVMDVTDMHSYKDDSFDVVMDKGTLDALMSEDTPKVREAGVKMLAEVSRVLQPGGRYICVTLWQDFIGSLLLSRLSGCIPITVSTASPSPYPSKEWGLKLHAVAARKHSPYLPLCLVATVSPGAGAGAAVSDEADSGGEVVVSARFDKSGRPLPLQAPSLELVGEAQVASHVHEAQGLHRRRYDLRRIRPGRFEQ